MYNRSLLIGRVRRWLMVCTCFCLTATASYAESENPILRRSVEDFDAIMKQQTRPCFIVAMAAWCAPCRRELPVINKLHDTYKDKGFTIIGLGLDLEGPQMLQPVVNKYKVKFPVYWVGETAIKAYEIKAIPLILIVKNGQITERIAGVHGKGFLKKKIESVLKQAR